LNGKKALVESMTNKKAGYENQPFKS